MDKFEKHSIYNVTFKLTDEDGKEESWELKPVPWSLFPKAFKLIGKMSDLQGAEGEQDLKQLFATFDEDTVKELSEVEFAIVKNSYPEKSDADIQKFVMANMFDLIEPMVNLTFKQTKVDKRKAEAALQK